MSGVDALLLACIAPFVLRGAWRGFAREVISLAALTAGSLLAIRHGRALGQTLEARLSLEPEAGLALAVAGLFLAAVVAGAVLGRLARRLLQAILLGPLDRVAGGALGVAQGVALVGLACLGVLQLASDTAVAADLRGSQVARSLVAVAGRLIEAVRPMAPAALGRTI